MTSQNIFDDDEFEDDESEIKKINASRSATQLKTTKTPKFKYGLNIKDRKYIEDALEQDPSIFDYDGAVDTSTESNKQNNLKSSDRKKSRYISNMLNSSERRKLENERHLERKNQRERQNESEELKNTRKEEFVTSSYKQKMEEFKLLDQLDEIEQRKESEQQSDMSAMAKLYLDSKTNGKESALTNINPIEKTDNQIKDENNLSDQHDDPNNSNSANEDQNSESDGVESSPEFKKRKESKIVYIEQTEDSAEIKQAKAKMLINEKFGRKVDDSTVQNARKAYEERLANFGPVIDSDSD